MKTKFQKASALAIATPLAMRIGIAVGCLIPTLALSTTTAFAEDRSLKLYFGHTGERATITFKRDGVYDQGGLNQLNHFLRDWRKNETIRMDPLLFDIVWEMYRRSGATDYVNVVSGYRSPNTNAMLRSRSSGVAKESQHTRGKAVDFFIPGVKLATLRGLGMQMQGGGVGYYPTSGSPFVHIDVGRVRAWPRMDRQELVRLFPDGRTLHIPSDGRPLPGYALAVADYKRRGSLSSVQIASVAGDTTRSGSTLLSSLFKSRQADEGDDPEAGADKASVATSAVFEAPIPSWRPKESALLTSLLPTQNLPAHQAIDAALSKAGSPDADQMLFAEPEQVPLPSFANRGSVADTDSIVTASIEPLPEALVALSEVPTPAATGAEALLGPVDHLPTSTFAVDRTKFWTASFTPRSVARGHHSNEPCPPMTVAKSMDGGVPEPC